MPTTTKESYTLSVYDIRGTPLSYWSMDCIVKLIKLSVLDGSAVRKYVAQACTIYKGKILHDKINITNDEKVIPLPKEISIIHAA